MANQNTLKALKGKYSYRLPNKNIRLSTEIVIVTLPKGESIKTKGILYLELDRDVNFLLKVKVPCTKSKAFGLIFNSIRLTIERDNTITWIIKSKKYQDNNEKLLIAAYPTQSRILYPDVNNLLRVDFHLLNFSDYIGKKTHHSENSVTAGRLSLNTKEWIITIDATPYTKRNLEHLKNKGGYGITHVGSLTRKNNEPFSSKDVPEIIKDLMYFLSFAQGMWVNPVLLSGKNQHNKEIWKGLFIHHTKPWKHPITWYDGLHANEILPTLFQNYSEKILNPIWNTVIQNTVYWYIQTNIPNVDSGVILGQTALELLAWTYLVIDKKILSKSKFKANNTSDNLRLLLRDCNIPLEIPNYAEQLRSMLGSDQDGVDLIVKIRNSLVHPEKSKIFSGAHYYQVLNLQKWYIELVLLRIMNYFGKYFNRLNKELWQGNVEPVPWK